MVDVRWSPEAGQTSGDVSSMAGVFSADCSPLCAAGGIQIEFICLGQFQFKYPAPGPGDGAAANWAKVDGDVGWPRQRVGTLQIAAGHDLAYQTLWTGGGTQKFKRKSKAYQEQ